jgi:hypothetical protein
VLIRPSRVVTDTLASYDPRDGVHRRVDDQPEGVVEFHRQLQNEAAHLRHHRGHGRLSNGAGFHRIPSVDAGPCSGCSQCALRAEAIPSRHARLDSADRRRRPTCRSKHRST